MKLVVTGAGIVGAAVARALATDGHEVVVIDQDLVCRGASRASFAWLNSNSRGTPSYHALSVLGMTAYSELARVNRYAPFVHFVGNVELASAGDELTLLAARVARLQALGYSSHMLAREAVRRWGGLLRHGDAVVGGAVFPGEGYIDVEPLVWTMLEEARECGALIRRGSRVEEVAEKAGRLRGVRLAGGEMVEADACVLCCGADVNRLLEPLGSVIPLKGKIGVAITTSAGAPQIGTIVHAPGISLRPAGGGRLLVHVKELDELVSDVGKVDLGAPELQNVWTSVTEPFVEVGGEWLAMDAWAARRPQPADGFPVAGALPNLPGLWVACTHSGVTLAPVLARLLCAGIQTGHVPEALIPYHIERFTRR